MSFNVLIPFLFLFSNHSLAGNSSITVHTKCTPYQFSYFEYGFQVHYSDAKLPDGSLVEMQVGYSGTGSVNSETPNEGEEFHWYQTHSSKSFEAKAGAALISEKLFYMQTSGYLSALEFRFKVTLPDGKVYWDNGGYSTSYYQAAFFKPHTLECDKVLDFTELPVDIVK